MSGAIRSVIFAIIFLLLVVPAQTQTSPASGPQLLKPEELDQLVAPIALYPDTLLAEVLMASAYPIDIVQAERWRQSHKNLKGDQLKAAIAKEDWDDSIKSLMATPDVLAMMSEKLEWTEKLGDAVVDQQPDVMDAIQRLRAKAQANNKLTSNKQQTVTVNEVQGKRTIAIAPTDPETVYVPYYDPSVVYGEWPYADYPPYYWPPPSYIGYGLLATGLAFGAGYALGNWWSGGYWGGNINWSGGGNNINITPPGNRPAHPISGPGGGNRWQPRVDHRQAGNRGGQRDFRGNRGQQVLNPGGRPGNRPGAENRPSNRPSTKPGAKPGGGQTNVGSNRPNKGANVSHRGQGSRQSAKARTSNRAASARPSHRGGGRQHTNIARGGHGGGGGMRARGGGGGRAMARGGGGRGGGGRGGGGRRSDLRLKHDVVLIGYLTSGIGLYRFAYNGGNTPYVGVIAQQVAQVAPEAVTRGRDGYLRVYYDKLGVKFQRYDQWYASAKRHAEDNGEPVRQFLEQ